MVSFASVSLASLYKEKKPIFDSHENFDKAHTISVMTDEKP